MAIAVLVFLLESKPKADGPKTPFIQQLRQMDPLGTLLFLPCIVCLFLALQWGGTTYTWSSWRIVLLFVLFAVLLIAFIAVQVFMPDTATIPIRIIKGRTMIGASLFCITCSSGVLVLAYYLPIFFQAIKGFSPTRSGIAALPFILALFIGTVGAGIGVQRLGYPAPFMILSAILAATGVGLITTWPVDVKSNMWIGYQVIAGFGVGLGMQQPNLLAQIVLDETDAKIGVSYLFFLQNLGGALTISIGQSVFTDELATQLSHVPGLHLSRQQIVEMGATTIKNLVTKDAIGILLEGYRIAIRNVFYVSVALSCTSMIGALLAEWRSVKKEKTVADEEKSAQMAE